MRGRGPLLALALLLVAAAAWFLLGKEPGPAGEQPSASGDSRAAPKPPLLGVDPPAAEPAAPEAVTEDELLEGWDPKEGTLMGGDRLHGIVVDRAGKPIANASVYLRSRPGQPAVVDAPETWNAATDGEGRWSLEGAWAARSELHAWAGGYERAEPAVPQPDTEIRIVLEKAPPVLVTVRAPKGDPRWQTVEQSRIRVRLAAEGSTEYPRAGEPLAAEWEQSIGLNTPSEVPMPRDAVGHLTADAYGYASEPAFHTVPNAAKEIVFQLVDSASITIAMADAKTGKAIPYDWDGGGYWSVTHVDSGFEMDSLGIDDVLAFRRGVSVGTYGLEVRYNGYKLAKELQPVEITRPGQRVKVEIPLERDLAQAILHLRLTHGKGAQLHGHRVEGTGLTLVRRRADPPHAWRQAWGRSMHVGKDVKQTLSHLAPGTYDVLAWDEGNAPRSGFLAGVKLEGGKEVTVELELIDGWGYRPSDVLDVKASKEFILRAECRELGVLPWVVYRQGVFPTNEKGFVIHSGRGYIGEYPFGQITLVERLPNGRTRKHPVKWSIGPPSAAPR